MKGLYKFSEEYFLKYRDTPVKIKPYRQKQYQIAIYYIQKVKQLLGKYKVEYLVRGSTAYKIIGKGEVEIGIYPNEDHWQSVLYILERKFGPPENLEDNYARFNDHFAEKDIEIIVLKGYEAEVDRKLHAYLLSHPELLREYEEVKLKYCFSKREYQRQKSIFLTKVIAKIPE